MTDFSEPIVGQIGRSVEQEFAAQVISGRRRVEGATRGRVMIITHYAGQDPQYFEGGLTWDLHGVTISRDNGEHIRWVPFSNIDWIEIEAGS